MKAKNARPSWAGLPFHTWGSPKRGHAASVSRRNARRQQRAKAGTVAGVLGAIARRAGLAGPGE